MQVPQTVPAESSQAKAEATQGNAETSQAKAEATAKAGERKSTFRQKEVKIEDISRFT